MRELEDFNPNLYASTPDYTCIITFNEQNYMDKTKWTIRTHFFAMMVLFLCVIKLHFVPRNDQDVSAAHGCWSRKHVAERLAPVFLLLEAFSHGLAGIYHAAMPSAEATHPLESLSQMFGMLACVILFLFALMVVMSTPHRLSRLVRLIWRFGITGVWLAVIYAYMCDGNEILLGVDLHMYILVGVCLLLLLAYGIRIFHTSDNDAGTTCHFLNKSLALLIIVLATAYAYNVYRKCGSYNGYLECFIRCPLPGGLNHSSFYNIAKLLALSGWAMAEDADPSVSLYELSMGLRTDEATIISDGPDLFDSDLDKDDEEDQNTRDQDEEQDVEANDLEARGNSVLTHLETNPTEESKNAQQKTLKIEDAPSSESQRAVDAEALSSLSRPKAAMRRLDEAE